MVGCDEQPESVADRAGERAALVAEQLGQQQVVGDRAAVLRQEELLVPVAEQVDRLGQQLLAGAGLAFDQHRQVGGRGLARHVADLGHLVADEHQLVEVVGLLQRAGHAVVLVADHRVGELQFAAQVAVDARQLSAFQCALEHQRELFGLEGLRDDLVDGRVVDRAHHFLAVRAAQRQHPHRMRLRDAHALQQIDAARVLELLLAHQHVRAVLGGELLDVGSAPDAVHGVLAPQVLEQRPIGQGVGPDQENAEFGRRRHDKVLCKSDTKLSSGARADASGQPRPGGRTKRADKRKGPVSRPGLSSTDPGVTPGCDQR